jgi:ribosomal protein L29
MNEINKLSASELEKRIRELRKELVDLIMRHGSGQLSDKSQLKKKRRVLARMLTRVSGEGLQNKGLVANGTK